MSRFVSYHSRALRRVVVGLAASALASCVAPATPYATCLTNAAGVISFRLNEAADNVKVISSGPTTNDLGALPKGLTVVNLGISGGFSVQVTKEAAGYLGYIFGQVNMISSDANRQNRFYLPTGVAVNNNPASPCFGRVFVANGYAGTTASGRPTGDGIYLLNSDLTDAVGQGDTARTAGLVFNVAPTGNSTYNRRVPWHLEVATNDLLYIADYSTNRGGILAADMDMVNGYPIFLPLFGLTNTAVHTTCNSSVMVRGSTNSGDLKIWAIDGRWPGSGQRNRIKRWDIGYGPLPWNSAPNATGGTMFASVDDVQSDLDLGSDGKFYGVCYRDAGTDVSSLKVFAADATTELFSSLTAWGSPDPVRRIYCCKLTPDARRIALCTIYGQMIFMALTNGIPDISSKVTLNTFNNGSASNAKDLSFDAAGNLYVVDGTTELLRVFTPGGGSVATTTSDGAFSIVRPALDTWTLRSSPTSQRLCSVTYGGSNYVAVGFGGTVLTSSNGVDWTSQISGTSTGLYSVAYGNGTFAAVGQIILSSTNGTDWVTRDSGPNYDFETVAYVNGAFMTVGANGAMKVSSDGITWSDRNSGTTTTLYGVAYGNGTYVVVGAGGTIRTSADGTNWTSRTSWTSQDLNGVIYDGGLFVTQGNYGVILTSTDGTNWTFRSSPTGWGLVTSASGFCQFVTVGMNGTILASINGIDWVAKLSGTSALLIGICAGPDSFVAVGDGGCILQSGSFPLLGIGRQPQSQTLEAGQTAQFSVWAWGAEPLSYQWRKDGVVLTDGGNISGAATGTLTLTNVQGVNAGGYDVVVSNAFGAVASMVALLTVNVAFPDAFNPGADTAVLSLALQADGKILVGGGFTTLGGETRNYIGRLNGDGTLDPAFNPGASGTVSSLAAQADGKILVGGWFTTLSGQPRNYIGRLNSNGTLDNTFNSGADGGLCSLAVQADGKILAGGDFTALGGQTRNRIGRLNSDGTLDTSFNPGANSCVYSLAAQADGKILVGGDFTALGGQTRNRIGRLNSDGTLDTTFNPGANGAVYALAVQTDGQILVGGYFSTLGGQPRTNIARLNASGTLDNTFNPGANGSVDSLAVEADGKILVGGGFTTLGGQTRNYIGRLNASGTLDNTFNPGANGSVGSLAVQADGKILVGGYFATLGGQPRINIARLNNTDPATQSLSYDGSTTTWLRGGTSPEVWRSTFDYSTNGIDWISLGTGTRITGGWQLTGLSVPADATMRARGFVTSGQYNGSGWFTETMIGPPGISVQPESVTNSAGSTASFSVQAGGTEPLSFEWRKDGVVLTNGGNISGAMTATLNISNLLKNDEGGYSVVVANAQGSVTSLVAVLTVVDPVITGQPDSQQKNVGESVTFSVTAAGTALTYQWRKNEVDLSDGGNVWGANTPLLTLTNLQGSDAANYTVVVSNLYGCLTSSVALLTVNLVSVDGGFNPGASWAGYYHDVVVSLAVQADGKILVGGGFYMLGGQPRDSIGRLNADGTLDAGFNPGAGGSVYPSPSVRALAVQADAKILVGGWFETLGGQPHTNLARLNADGTLDNAFNPAAGGVHALALQVDGKILVGGNFSTLNGQTRNFLGRLNSDGTLDTGFNPGADMLVYTLAVQADGKILVGGYFTTLAGQACSGLGRLNANGTLDTTFNPGVAGSFPYVLCLAVQADGKILMGGGFTMLGGQPRNHIARLNADGTLDSGFNPGTDYDVDSLAIQADGKILVGGDFRTLGGQPRTCLGRLNADGTLDPGFNPGANNTVLSLALQADGKILVGGQFTALGAQPRDYLGRLNNTDPATQNLAFDGSTITWLRGGASPEVWRTTFDYSTNGTDWVSLGAGTRIAGGWKLAGIPALPTSTLRARGFVTGGEFNGSSWFVESTMPFVPQTPPTILTGDSSFGFRTNQFGFNVAGVAGQTVVIEASTDLLNWIPLATNLLGASPLYFSDPDATNFAQRFYRARLGN